MAEFVACVQSQAIDDTQGKGQCEELENIHRMRGHPPATDNQGCVVNRNGQVGQHPIVTILFAEAQPTQGV